MAIYTVPNNSSITIDVNSVVNSGSNGAWKIVGNTLVHDNTRKSYIEKQYSALVIGKTYKVTLTTSNVTCNWAYSLGSQETAVQTTSGIKTNVFTYTSGSPKLRIWANGNITITNIKIESLNVITQVQEIPNTSKENKGFTLSYYPQLDQWCSFHSYLPNNYIVSPKSLLTKRNDSQIKQFNKNSYGLYFNTVKPFILETVFNEYPTDTKIFDNLTINLKSELLGKDTNKFFDKLYLYTEQQCSGEIVLNTTNLTKKEKNWMINKFNDLTNNSNELLFTEKWDDIKNEYPIDKKINVARIDNNKPWYQRGRFRDKFLKVRFIENNFDDNKLICNFVSTIYRPSQR